MLSIFCARLAVSRPTPPKVSDPKPPSNAIENMEPRTHVKEHDTENEQQADFNDHQQEAAGHDGKQEIPAAHRRTNETFEQLALAHIDQGKS